MKVVEWETIESLTNFRGNNCKKRAAYVIWKANGEQCPFCTLNLRNLTLFRIHCLGIHSHDYLPMEAYKLKVLLEKVKDGCDSNPNNKILVNYKLNPKDAQFITDEYWEMVNVYERRIGLSEGEMSNFTPKLFHEEFAQFLPNSNLSNVPEMSEETKTIDQIDNQYTFVAESGKNDRSVPFSTPELDRENVTHSESQNLYRPSSPTPVNLSMDVSENGDVISLTAEKSPFLEVNSENGLVVEICDGKRAIARDDSGNASLHIHFSEDESSVKSCSPTPNCRKNGSYACNRKLNRHNRSKSTSTSSSSSSSERSSKSKSNSLKNRSSRSKSSSRNCDERRRRKSKESQNRNRRQMRRSASRAILKTAISRSRSATSRRSISSSRSESERMGSNRSVTRSNSRNRRSRSPVTRSKSRVRDSKNHVRRSISPINKSITRSRNPGGFETSQKLAAKNKFIMQKEMEGTKKWARRFMADALKEPKTGNTKLDAVNSELLMLATSFLNSENNGDLLMIDQLLNKRGEIMKETRQSNRSHAYNTSQRSHASLKRNTRNGCRKGKQEQLRDLQLKVPEIMNENSRRN